VLELDQKLLSLPSSLPCLPLRRCAKSDSSSLTFSPFSDAFFLLLFCLMASRERERGSSTNSRPSFPLPSPGEKGNKELRTTAAAPSAWPPALSGRCGEEGGFLRRGDLYGRPLRLVIARAG